MDYHATTSRQIKQYNKNVHVVKSAIWKDAKQSSTDYLKLIPLYSEVDSLKTLTIAII